MLLKEESNAFSGEKQCFAPQKAVLGRNLRIFGPSWESVPKVGFLELCRQKNKQKQTQQSRGKNQETNQIT